MEGSVLTPWGPSDTLRDRRLRPGPGIPRADVERNQRERLYGAMVAVVDEGGYEGMRVGRVAARAGVSRSALYEYFRDRQECFLATFEALVDDGIATLTEAYEDGPGPPEQRLLRALDALIELLVAQPAAGRLCFLEAYAAGPPAAALRERATDALEGLVWRTAAEMPRRRQMPEEVLGGIVGGIRIVIQTRLRRRTEHELRAIAPELRRWMLCYETPDPPLRAVQARDAGGPGFVATTHEQRLFVALARTVSAKGYAETIIADVVAAASMSLSTFYTTFESKETAFLAACDFGVDQAFAAARHAYARETEWPLQVRAGIRELLAFLAAEPEWAYMATVEILAAGPRARARRDRTLDLFTSLLSAGYDHEDGLGPVAVEAVGGAVYSLIYRQTCNRGAERLPEILPACVFILLAPFVGNDEAARVATLS
jgi:AcrR family transcriptional regulator